jgi:CubicO group peptidase (beta-lactamase class C family)
VAPAALLGVRSPEPVRAVPAAVAVPAHATAIGAAAPALDEHFEKTMKDVGATGVAVALLSDGAVVYERFFGVKDASTNTPIDGDTVFRIASMTKSFTALSVMKLRDEGKLSLDAPASTYVPELARLAPPVRDAPPVTARLLMTHASGLAYDDLWGTVTYGLDDAELWRFIEGGVSFGSVPGTKYAYSNLGYALLGKIVERVSGSRYRDYVAANILRPLGMSSGAWESKHVPSSALAVGYHRDGETLVEDEREPDGVFDAAGGLYVSFHDYLKYASYNLRAYPPRDDVESGPVRRSTLREMHTGQRSNRSSGDKELPIVRRTDDGLQLSVMNGGFGWHSVANCHEERLTHGGFEPGYYANVVLFPKARIGIVVLATSGPVGHTALAGTYKILREAKLIGVPTPPSPHPALVAAKDALTSLLARSDPPLFARTFSPKSLRYWWNANLASDLEKLGHAHGACRPDGELRAYGWLSGSFRLACERGAVEFEVLMGPEKPPLVQNVHWKEELVPEERIQKAAARVAALIGTWNDAAAEAVFAPPIDRLKIKKRFAHLALDHGACTVESGAFRIARADLTKDPGKWVFRLKCSQAPLELSFGLDDKTGKVAHLSADPLRAPEAACWE